MAASHIDGQTAHVFCLKRCLHCSFKGEVLIYEISMMPLPLLACLEQLRLNGTFFILFWDFAQIEPCSNSWRGAPIRFDAFERNRLFRQSDPKVFVLQTCYRSDKNTFRCY